MVIKNVGDKFVDLSPKSGLENQIGWWFSIYVAWGFQYFHDRLAGPFFFLHLQKN
jgi:hypothetical protein